jgi:hypothetical protein
MHTSSSGFAMRPGIRQIARNAKLGEWFMSIAEFGVVVFIVVSACVAGAPIAATVAIVPISGIILIGFRIKRRAQQEAR